MSHPDWWVDYVEDEMDTKSKNLWRLWLKNSPKDQELLDSLTEVKHMLLKFQDTSAQISEDQMSRLHDRIMAEVEQRESW